ncbi:MAG: hypothetical protein UT24_C0041G0002 [Candidatus Woesebacteria bacterium GW2011_GWB1_39_12]|uniref:Uncharacterized protein n=1 Tax=Candidatus Woesebacteria bacterium GW2011_GWB1_39_12 TaxID=1618574 RepID=A0A0G0M440_9BACT|nr:MAG: hypothetical protein UT24_C0041G0002 [Candidatus Woesebacteria bacterium GW2011_GWB1_39_12]
MATLVERDRIENGGSGVLTTKPGETEHEFYLSATKWRKSQKQFRIGCTIGPHRYFANEGQYTPASELDDRPSIDLKPTLSARSGVRFSMGNCGYVSDCTNDGTISMARRGVKANLKVIGLAWINQAGKVQPIARVIPGFVPVADEDGWWAKDALGAGIDLGVRLWPDMMRPVIRINDVAALPKPTIGEQGLHLVKVLGVGWQGSMPAWAKGTSTLPPDDWSLGSVDADVPDPGKFQLANGLRGLWFHEPRAWDAAGNDYPMMARWQRRGQSHVLLCGLPADVALAATGALTLDTTMAEQQVGASADDVYVTYGFEIFNLTAATNGCGDSNDSQYDIESGIRFSSVPIPVGATIGSSSISLMPVSSSGTLPITTHVYSELSASAAQFGTRANYLARSLTATSGDWVISAWPVGTWQVSEDVAVQAQQPIALPEWVSGNPMAFFWKHGGGWGGVAQVVNARSYNSSTTLSPKLNAAYTEGGGDTHGFDFWQNGQTVQTLPGAGTASFDHWQDGQTMMAFLTGGEAPAPDPSSNILNILRSGIPGMKSTPIFGRSW